MLFVREIPEIIGKTIYVVKKGFSGWECNKYTVEAVFIYDKTHLNEFLPKQINYIYDLQYEDCWDSFTIEDIGKTIFFNKHDAEKKVAELNC